MVLIGDGPERRQLVSYCKELNIQDREPQQRMTQELEKLVSEHNDVEVNLSESNILKFEREPTEKVRSDFVAGWVRRINEELVTLKDGEYTTDQNKIQR